MAGDVATRAFRVANQAARTEVGEGVVAFDGGESGDPSPAQGHYDFASSLGVPHVSTELVVQFADSDLGLQLVGM